MYSSYQMGTVTQNCFLCLEELYFTTFYNIINYMFGSVIDLSDAFHQQEVLLYGLWKYLYTGSTPYTMLVIATSCKKCNSFQQAILLIHAKIRNIATICEVCKYILILWTISVDFDVTDQLLIKFSAFVRYWK
jgi:hypothetical protein